MGGEIRPTRSLTQFHQPAIKNFFLLTIKTNTMNSNLLFDFSVNKETNTIKVQREFASARPIVWKAWTTAELLDQWWAPFPFKNKTKKLDFSVGGFWLYAMHGPENQVHWARFDYEDIQHEVQYQGLDAFCDDQGNINTDFDRMHWTNVFSDKNGHTLVDITIQLGSLETLEKIIAMGFKEGFTMGMNQLDEVLTKGI
jgi:uncharacterized protein YndB with AHSA1/START domain